MTKNLKNEIKEDLKKNQLKPLKRLGQNFLIDETIIKKFVNACNIQPEDTIIEIGPGTGVLTREITKKAKKVIAVEKDPKIIGVLKNNLRNFKNIKIVNKSILELEALSFKFKVVGNLPYYLTAPVIRKFLESKNPPEQIIFMIQKEVAQRICSKPPKTNILAVSVQFYAKPEIISYVSKKSFFPEPKVDSAIIKIMPVYKYKNINADLFFKIVKAGFSQPRKQLANNLSKGLKLNKEKVRSLLLKNNIKPERRAETLNIEEWIRLTNF